MRDAVQLSFDDYDGRVARDIGMVEAEFAEVLSGSTYLDALEAAIKHVARRQCEVHIDDVLPLLRVKATHPNSAGSVWRRLVNDGTLVKSDSDRFRPCSVDPGKHRHDYRVYRSGLFFGRGAA